MFNQNPTRTQRRAFQPADLVAFAIAGFFLYGVVSTAQRWSGQLVPDVAIDLSLSALPEYSLFSLFRGMASYVVSLAFTLVTGYLAAKNRYAEKILIPLLDIGQSIPVMGFLPGLVLGLIAIFPNTNLGLELACILMIVTGQAWNMAFSFYQSVKTVPQHFFEVSDMVGLSWFQRLIRIELPYSAIPLAWNSLMSMAGGWVFLIVCESFKLGERNFRLPGLGSYMSVAIEQGNARAQVAGVLAMITIIVFLDFVVWRPIIAWTGRFRTTADQQDEAIEIPFISLLLKDTAFLTYFFGLIKTSLSWFRNQAELVGTKELSPLPQNTRHRIRRLAPQKWVENAFRYFIYSTTGIGGFWLIGKLFNFMTPLSNTDWIYLLNGTLLTCGRVILAVIISTIWALPAGILIGLSQKWTRRLQPAIQIIASFPAPMIYPIIVAYTAKAGLGLNISSILLMVITVQWYLLFNVLAGAVSISTESRETLRLMGFSSKDKWKKLYLPSVFPSLVTGWLTTAGGAWNASIVAEYIHSGGKTLSANGLGAIISVATETENYPMLTGALVILVTIVVLFNRLVWNRLYAFAEDRFGL